jgi:hypothetical protein
LEPGEPHKKLKQGSRASSLSAIVAKVHFYLLLNLNSITFEPLKLLTELPKTKKKDITGGKNT